MTIIEPSLVVASGNVGKIKEFCQLLSCFPLNVIGQPEGFYVEETGQTFIQNARLKALAVACETGQWSLADDSGLCVEALSGEPGVHSARYAKNDPERINRLLIELEPFSNRDAYFSASLCIASPQQKILIEVEARCEGTIALAPRGKAGFGYDPIFEVGGTGFTFAQMSEKQKQLMGHRGSAFSLLEPKLKELLRL